MPLIVSHEGAVHKESVTRWKDIAKDIKVDWVRMAQNVLRYNVVIVGKFFNKRKLGVRGVEEGPPGRFLGRDHIPIQRESNLSQSEESSYICDLTLRALSV